jgi:hypothetical protein
LKRLRGLNHFDRNSSFFVGNVPAAAEKEVETAWRKEISRSHLDANLRRISAVFYIGFIIYLPTVAFFALMNCAYLFFSQRNCIKGKSPLKNLNDREEKKMIVYANLTLGRSHELYH